MRIARVGLDGQEICAIEFKGQYYRVDALDEILGFPCTDDLTTSAALFHRRVFGLGMMYLHNHLAELAEGALLDDAVIYPHPFWLPPCGRHAALTQLVTASGHDVMVRLNDRAVYGHEGVGMLPMNGIHLKVQPAIAVILGDDLHFAGTSEVVSSILGYSLALCWELLEDEAIAACSNLGPSVKREVGTHLGPCIWVYGRKTPAPSFDPKLQVEGQEAHLFPFTPDLNRIAQAVGWATRFSDVRAGDVVLLPCGTAVPVPPGRLVTVSSPPIGVLRGRVGGAPGLPHRQ
jgi:hypothetical protein